MNRQNNKKVVYQLKEEPAAQHEDTVKFVNDRTTEDKEKRAQEEEMARKVVLRSKGVKAKNVIDRMVEVLASIDHTEDARLSIKRRSQRKAPWIKFADGKADPDNFLSFAIDEKTFIEKRQMVFALINNVGTCQSMEYIISQLLKRFKDPMFYAKPYFYKGRLLDITIENMSTEIMEDLAIYAFVEERAEDVCFNYKTKQAHKLRQKLIAQLKAKAEEHINRYYPTFYDKFDCKNSWASYIFISFLIKRTYGINVFQGDGSDFFIAYLTSWNDDEITISNEIYILHQYYNLIYQTPDGIDAWKIHTEEKDEEVEDEEVKDENKVKITSGHCETIFSDGICMLYIDGKEFIMLFVLKEGFSPLRQIYEALTVASTAVSRKSDEPLIDYKNFSHISQNCEVFTAFNQSSDFSDFVIPRAYQ